MKHIHFIGIGGAGLSAIALILLEKGFTVSGSDRERSAMFDAITGAGARTYIGHAPEHILGTDLVIRSSAISDDNPEVIAAQASGIPVIKRQDFLPELTAGKRTLAVAGTHGKTTTTAMLIWMLTQMGLDPSFISGGTVNQLGCNAHSGTGPHFVIEADEYDHMFLGLNPEIAVITNVEHDHTDCFPTPADYEAAFNNFIHCIQPGGKLLACLNDPGVRSLLSDLDRSEVQVQTYGTAPDAHYSAKNIIFKDGFPQFDLVYQTAQAERINLGTINLQVPGHHNVLNGTAALGVIHQLDLPLDKAIQPLGEFTGAGRRFEVLGQVDGVTLINDYGHHPTEIAATLEAARTRYPGHRIWAVWQPHTFSRTQNLADRFVQALNLADQVMVLKIYAAREADPGYSADQIARAIPDQKALYAPDFSFASEYLLKNLSAEDILIIFSAGDAIQLGQMVMEGLQQQEINHQGVNP